ncbi:hypothetical protein [Kribbella sp. NBC_00889]|nr:hypothetical protein OG817_32485 [Kribbella sp. NBC_00889]
MSTPMPPPYGQDGAPPAAGRLRDQKQTWHDKVVSTYVLKD